MSLRVLNILIWAACEVAGWSAPGVAPSAQNGVYRSAGTPASSGSHDVLGRWSVGSVVGDLGGAWNRPMVRSEGRPQFRCELRAFKSWIWTKTGALDQPWTLQICFFAHIGAGGTNFRSDLSRAPMPERIPNLCSGLQDAPRRPFCRRRIVRSWESNFGFGAYSCLKAGWGSKPRATTHFLRGLGGAPLKPCQSTRWAVMAEPGTNGWKTRSHESVELGETMQAPDRRERLTHRSECVGLQGGHRGDNTHTHKMSLLHFGLSHAGVGVAACEMVRPDMDDLPAIGRRLSRHHACPNWD